MKRELKFVVGIVTLLISLGNLVFAQKVPPAIVLDGNEIAKNKSTILAKINIVKVNALVHHLENGKLHENLHGY